MRLSMDFICGNIERTNCFYVSQTLVPSEQFAQMSMFFRPPLSCFLNCTYDSSFHISLNDFCFKSPSLCCASLSKQQGTTNPSQVITGSCHKRQQWLESLPLNSYPFSVLR